MDSDFDSDDDTETQLEELKQLNAVLIADEGILNEPIPCNNSFISILSKPTGQLQELGKIDSALSLNKALDEKYRRLEQILETRLKECREKITQNSDNLYVQNKTEFFRYVLCGKPYFRDRHNFPAPDNDDTIMMKNNQMYDFSNVISVPGWTVRDKNQFVTVIHKMSKDIRKNALQSKISQINRQTNQTPSKKVENKKAIAKIRKEIELIDKKPLSELALPVGEEYDWETLSNKLSCRHTPLEYRSLWQLFFHPSINKRTWSKSEHTQLQKLATKYNFQNWEGIARELKTTRTGYQCFVYYRTNMHNTFVGRKWTPEEEEYLKRLIEFYREDKYIPWGKVAASMENRTKMQIYNKYLRLIEKRKGRFLPEEDSVILHCAKKFGRDYKKMANFLPGRSIIQVRNRHNVLRKMTVSAVWTSEDDKNLLQVMANQDKLTDYSSVTKYFPDKDRINIRSRYLTLLRWMRANPNSDIAMAPRRAARRLNHGYAAEDLSEALENLRNRMQCEVETRTKKSQEPTDKEIHDAILAVFVTEAIKKGQNKDAHQHTEYTNITTDSQEQHNITNLTRIILLLNGRLNRSKFLNSTYSKKYPDFGKPKLEICPVKVKCYSRKQTTKTMTEVTPDVWGNLSLGAMHYVLPPNYATITATRVLMDHLSTNEDLSDVDLKVLMRRNPVFKRQLMLLLERYVTLGLWPMMLSSTNVPKNPGTPGKKYECPSPVKKRSTPLPEPAVGLPSIHYMQDMDEPDDSDGIDLDEDEEREDIAIVETFMDIDLVATLNSKVE